MKKLPILTAAVIAAGAAVLAPTEAKACETCADMNGGAMCKTENSGTFGACYIDESYDECGEPTGTDCYVYFDPNCGGGVNWGTYPMAFESYICVYLSNGCGGS